MDEWKGLAATILVVAGPDLDRATLEPALGGGRRTVDWCAGDEAAERVAAGGLDLLLLDLGAPGAEALALIDQGREANPGMEVVVLTGAEEVPLAAEAIEHGAADYLTKPVDPAGLGAVVDRVLDLRRLQIAGHIATIVHRIAATEEAEKLPPRVVDATLQATRARHAAVYLYEAGALERVGSTQEEEPEEVRALAERVLDTGRPIQTLEDDEGPILGWPMVAHGAGIGVLIARRDPGRPFFTAADEQQMSIVASEAALSLDRVRLVDRLRRQVDALARTRWKLAAAEQLQGVGLLATGYAHELQGPLQYLQSHLRAAAEALETDDLEEVASGLRIALETAARIQSTVGELSLLGRGKDDAVVDARRLVSLARRIARIDKRVAVDEAVRSCAVEGNVGHLVQALVHLLKNAARAVQEVDRPAIRIEVLPEGAEVRFSIEDNGPGLDPAVADRLFEPFVSTWEGQAGLGLGVARAIAEAAGGRLVVRDRPRGGAEASLWLPGLQDDSTLELGDD